MFESNKLTTKSLALALSFPTGLLAQPPDEANLGTTTPEVHNGIELDLSTKLKDLREKLTKAETELSEHKLILRAVELRLKICDRTNPSSGRPLFRLLETAAAPISREHRFTTQPLVKDDKFWHDVIRIQLAQSARQESELLLLTKNKDQALELTQNDPVRRLAGKYKWLLQTVAEEEKEHEQARIKEFAKGDQSLEEMLLRVYLDNPESLFERYATMSIWGELEDAGGVCSRMFSLRAKFLLKEIAATHPELGRKLDSIDQIKAVMTILTKDIVTDFEFFGPQLELHQSLEDMRESGGPEVAQALGYHDTLFNRIHVPSDTVIAIALILGHELGHGLTPIADIVALQKLSEKLAIKANLLQTKVKLLMSNIEAAEKYVEAQKKNLGAAENLSLIHDLNTQEFFLESFETLGHLGLEEQLESSSFLRDIQKFSVQTQLDELAADLMQACVIAKLAELYPDCTDMLFELRYIWSYPSSATHFGAYRVSQELIEEHNGDAAKALRWFLARPYEQLVQNLGPRVQAYNDLLQLGDSPMAERIGQLSRGFSWYREADGLGDAEEKLLATRQALAKNETLQALIEQHRKDSEDLAILLEQFLDKYSPQGFKLKAKY